MVLRLVVTVLHYMFRPTWPSSGAYDVFSFVFLKESASLLLLPLLRVVIPCTFSCLVVAALHYMSRPTWPSSGAYDVFYFVFLKESDSLLLLPFLARGYTMHVLMFSCRCSSLHVSAYMAIFKCVCFTFIFLKESAFVAFVARGYAMQFLICVFLLCFR
jgi:hypothetical protein